MQKAYKEITKGDRIFARLVKDGRTIVEFMINCVGSMDEVLSEIGRMAGGLQGLARLFVRNQSRGWSEERLLRLYISDGSAATGLKIAVPTGRVVPVAGLQAAHMPFPWETH